MTHARPHLVGLAIALLPALAAAQPASPTRPTLSRGTATTDGNGATAGPSGAEWSVPGGPRVLAQPGAVLRVLPTPQPLQLSPQRRVAGYTLVVKSGQVEVRVPPQSTSTLVVVAPRQVNAIVDTGVLRVAVVTDSTALANLEGASTVAVQGGAYRALGAGRVFVATAQAQDTRDLVTPPRALHGKRLRISTSGRARFVGLSWDPVTGAEGYRVELVDASTGSVRAATELTEPKLTPTFDAQPAGRYLLRVSSRDPSGIATRSALEVPLGIVGVELPKGAYIDTKGAYRLGPRQRVRLRGAEGFEMSAGSKFVPAARTVGMLRDDPMSVRLRLPGTTDTVEIVLVPKSVRARIEISPRNAVWPRDRVEIRFRLEDPSGEAVPHFIEATPRVTVNVEDVSLRFTRRDGWLRGVLPAKRGAGPWVVRVSVQDEQAQPLGYEFAEIAPGPNVKRESSSPERRQSISRR